MAEKRDLGSGSIGKLMLKMAVPAVLAQVVNMLYNIVDRIYIGNIPEIGGTALTALGVTSPILMMVAAFAAFAGQGGAPLAAIKLGEKDNEGAGRILGSSFAMLISLSVLLTAGFLIFKEPLLYAFGASANTIGYANDYITIYLIGTVFVQLALGLNTFITAQGHSKTAMYSVLIGAVMNIILDPIFIFVLDMNVRGAALATIISQAASALWVVRFLTKKSTGLRIQKKYVRFDLKIMSKIAALGVAPFIMQSTESFVSITLNSGLQSYGGDAYVGSMTIMMSVLQMVVVPITGLSQGAQPILSFNYGAKKYDRVRKCFKFQLMASMIVSTLGCLTVMLMPQVFVRMFGADQSIFPIAVKYLPVFIGGIWAFGMQMACQGVFLSLGQAKISLFLALLRKIILLIPLAIILPRFWGVTAIYFSEPIADILASFTTMTLFMLKRKTLLPVDERLQK